MGPGYLKQHLSLKSGVKWNFTRHLHRQKKLKLKKINLNTFRYIDR